MAKGKGASAPKKTGETRLTAPLSPKAARVMVTESNHSVEWQVESSGGLPIRASYDAGTAVRELATCDGLLITGGGDVNPALYGEARHREVYGLSAGRDLRELALLGAARELGIPVLGICRGMQVIAVEAGGTLLQHVPDKVRHQEHGASMMPVVTVRGSQVARALGAYPDMLHLHHQSVKKVPAGFQVTARHNDGTVEAIESTDGRVIGVQFHPESVMGTSAGHTGYRLFETFVSACTRYRRRTRDKGRVTLRPAVQYVEAWPVAVEALASHQDWKLAPVAPVAPKKSGASVGTTKTTTKTTRFTRQDLEPIAWCCGVTFDFYRDYQDHTAYFHNGQVK